MNKQHNLHSKDTRYRIAICIICSCQSLVSLALSMMPAKRLDNSAHPNVGLYVLGMFILFLFFFTFLSFLKKLIPTALIITVGVNLLAIINYYELKLHGTVLTHQDIRNITTAVQHIGSYKLELSLHVKAIVLSFLVVQFVLVFMHTRNYRIKRNVTAGFTSAVTLFCLIYVLVLSPFPILKIGSWSWERKYYTDGFVIGTLENLSSVFHIAIKLEGYEDALKSLEPKETDEPVWSGETVKDYPDIIMVLNETYYDIGMFLDFEPDNSYMHYYNTMDAYKGYAAVPYAGGGTNASEYELLTCNSMALINSSSPFNDLHFSESPSLVAFLKELGYETLAAHPFIPGNYHRNTVWKELGFDKMFFVSDFSYLDFYGKRSYCTDSSAFRSFKEFYEQMPENSPRFAYLLTIQNHGDWDVNASEEDIIHIGQTNGLLDSDINRVEEYMSCIKLTDDFISEMISYFSDSDRNVIVYMVGDHCPSFLNEEAFDDTVKTDNTQTLLDDKTVSDLRKRQVPYFIWSNQPDVLQKLPVNRNIDLCALSAYAMKAAGLPISLYHKQLLKMSENAICITGIDIAKEGIGYVNDSGETSSIYSISDTANDVKKYFYMEYNCLDKGSRIEQLFSPFITDTILSE